MIDMTPLGSARPTCENCGAELEIRMFGHPTGDATGDIEQITFQLPAKHRCRPPAPTPLAGAGDDEPAEPPRLRAVVGL